MDVQSMAVPYLDLDVIGFVANRLNPTGPLGGLGPLPEVHRKIDRTSNLATLTVALEDKHIRDILTGLAGPKRVAVVVAGTGTGKSTFMPFRLLHPPSGVTYRPSDNGRIVVTEPRVLAAKGTAGFVAEAMAKSHVGVGSEIGFRAGGESAFDGATRLLYVTDGALINWIRDGRLREYGMVIIDEAHERSRNIDIILGLLKAALPRHPDLRVIVTSATMDASFFVDYFGGPDKVHTLDVAGNTWGYGEPLWPNEEIDLDHADWERPGPGGEDLRALTRNLLELRLNSPIPEREWRQRMPILVADQALKIMEGTDDGDILAFLPGRAAIEEAVARIEKNASKPVDVYPLLSTTSPTIQRRACAARGPGDKRRVVVATNIAETSLTIGGISYVIDSGLINQRVWDPDTASGSVPSKPHSRDGVRQRWGRAGRNAPGWVFPLYTREQYEGFPAHTAPESCRDDLEQFYLSALASGIGDPESFEWPMSFERDDELGEQAERRDLFRRELKRAGRALRSRGAVDDERFLTAAGREIERSVGEAGDVMALIAADQAGCAIELRAAVAALSGRSLIGDLLRYQRAWSPAWRLAVQRRHLALMAGCADDLDFILKLVGGWQAADDDARWGRDRQRRRRAFAAHHLLSHDRLKAIEKGIQSGLAPLQIGKRDRSLRDVEPRLAPRLRRVLAATLPDRIWVRGEAGWRPESDPNWTRPTRVVDRPWVSSLRRAIVWKRRSYTDGAVELDHLIALPDDVASMTTAWDFERRFWGLMVSCARELGPSLEDHWRMQHTSRVGWRLRLPEGTITPTAEDLFDALSRFEDEEEDQDDEDESADTADEGRAELVYVAGPGLVVSVPDLDEDPGELGVEEDEPTEKRRKRAARATPVPAVWDFAQDPVVSDDEDLTMGGDWEVVGFRGVGADRVAVIEPVVQPDSKPLDELQGRRTFVGPAWPGPRVALFIDELGQRLVLDSEMGLLDPFDWEGLARLGPGPHALTVTDVEERLWMLEGTRLPFVASAFWELVKSSKQTGGPRATVRELRRDWSRVELDADGALEGTWLSVHLRSLQYAGIPAAVGARLLLSECQVNRDGHSRRFQEALPEKPGVGLRYNPEDGQLTVTKPPLSVSVYRKLAACLSSDAEQARLRRLWLDSHRVHVRKVQGFVDDSDFDDIRPGRVIGLDYDGAWLVLPGGGRARLDRNALSVGNRTPAFSVLGKGDLIDVSLARGANGVLEALPVQTLDEVAPDRTWFGVVQKALDSGLVVRTEFGEGWLYVGNITEGFLDEAPADLFSEGHPVIVTVDGVEERGPQLGLVAARCADGSWLGGARSEDPDLVDEFVDGLDGDVDWTNLATWERAFPDLPLDLWAAVAGYDGTGSIGPGQAIRMLQSQQAVDSARRFAEHWTDLDKILESIGHGSHLAPRDLIAEASKQMSSEQLQQWLGEFSARLEQATATLDARLGRIERAQAAHDRLVEDLREASKWLEEHEQELARGFETLKRDNDYVTASISRLRARLEKADEEVYGILEPLRKAAAPRKVGTPPATEGLPDASEARVMGEVERPTRRGTTALTVLSPSHFPGETASSPDTRLVVTLSGDADYRRTYYGNVNIDRNALRGAVTRDAFELLQGTRLRIHLDGGTVFAERHSGSPACSINEIPLDPDVPLALQLGVHCLKIQGLALQLGVQLATQDEPADAADGTDALDGAY